MSESRTFAREKTLVQEHGDERVESSVKRGGFRVEEGEQAKRTSLGEVGGSMNG